MKLGAYKIDKIPVSEIQHISVADLNGKPAFVIAEKLPSAYKDITNIENLHTYGRGLIGSAEGFKDWKCLQREIKELVMTKVKNDLKENWNKLSQTEKQVACKYMLGKIPPDVFAALVPEAAERAAIAQEYDSNNRQARGSWSGSGGRTQAIKHLLYSKLGTRQAQEVIADMLKEGLFHLYEGGVEGTEEDGNIGINDFFQARKKTPYATNGLKKRKYQITDGSSDTVKELADKLSDIITKGTY